MSKRIKARDYKTLRGFFNSPKRWIQHASTRKDGEQCCLIGAIGQIFPNYSKCNPKFSEACRKVEDSIEKFYKLGKHTRKGETKPPYISIVKFNDTWMRSFKDIQWVIKDAKV